MLVASLCPHLQLVPRPLPKQQATGASSGNQVGTAKPPTDRLPKRQATGVSSGCWKGKVAPFDPKEHFTPLVLRQQLQERSKRGSLGQRLAYLTQPKAPRLSSDGARGQRQLASH